MSLILRTPLELQNWRKQAGSKTVGLVPTMGALHSGHESLLKRAKAENDFSVLSIFVNPTQFNNPEDLKKYPATWDQDLEKAEKNGVDVIFYPQFADMYPDSYRYKLSEKEFSLGLCGKDRPGHFDGVLTVVMKLLNLAQATKAYFGEKDYQQLKLVTDMARAFFISTEIVAMPTVREADGLAMSSRNLRLSPPEREKAPAIFKTIKTATTAAAAKTNLEQLGFKVDYVTDIENRRFVAAYLGEVRLIDNIKL